MLERIRSGASGKLAWIIIGMIMIPFVFFGIEGYFDQRPSAGVVAVVGSTKISQNDLSAAYKQQYQRLQEMYGEALQPGMIDESVLKKAVLDELVSQAILAHTVKDTRFMVNDKQLADYIRSLPLFSDNGSFSEDRYRQFRSQESYSAERFESRLRQELMIDQLRTGITDSATATNWDIDQYVRLRDEKRKVAYLLLPWQSKSIRDEVKVSDEAINDYYKQQGDKFTTPERVRLAYVELTPEAVAASVTLDDKQLRTIYDEEVSNFTKPERRQISHILIRGLDDAAQAKAAEIKAKLKAGEAFDKLAKEYSQDPVSAIQGGALGWLSKGMLESALEVPAFGLKAGETSDPVLTADSYQLIRVDAIEAGAITPFAEVKTKLEQQARAEKIKELLYDLGEQIDNLAFENPSSLDVLAKLPIVKQGETIWLTRGKRDQWLLEDAKVYEAAFSVAVISQGQNSPVLTLADGRRVVLRLLAHEAAVQKSLAEVKAEVTALFVEQQAKDAVKKLAESWEVMIANGDNPETLAGKQGAVWKSVGEVGRRGGSADAAAIVDFAFSIPLAKDNKPAVKVMALPGGDQAIVVVLDRQPGNPADVTAEQRTELRKQLEANKGNNELGAVVKGFRSAVAGKVKVYSDQI